jgi:membrane-associated protease RseP (regulator of RpoE activity)
MENSTEQLSPASPSTERQQGAVSSAVLGDMGPVEPAASVTNPFGLALLAGLLILLWRWGGVNAVLFVFGLVVMIFLHELGHFITARKTGMKATRFFVGMGPTIISRTWGETEYGLKAIPAGAFVAISGMHNLDPVAPEDEPRAYKNASYPRRMLVITAGSMMHFMQAILIFIFMFSVIGAEDLDGAWTIRELSTLDDGSDAPAIAAGLELGDKIVSIDGERTLAFEDLRSYVQPRPGAEVTLGIERDGELFEAATTLAAVPHEQGADTGFLGVGAKYERVQMSPTVGARAFKQVFTGSFAMMGRIFSPSGFQNLGSLMFQGSEDVSLSSDEAAERPVSLVGIVRIAGDDQFDWFGRLFFLGSINIFVGIFNLMPVLPLDGGHAAIATYERIRSRKGRAHHVDFAKLLPITYGVVGLLGFLFISTLWLDILRPIG